MLVPALLLAAFCHFKLELSRPSGSSPSHSSTRGAGLIRPSSSKVAMYTLTFAPESLCHISVNTNTTANPLMSNRFETSRRFHRARRYSNVKLWRCDVHLPKCFSERIKCLPCRPAQANLEAHVGPAHSSIDKSKAFAPQHLEAKHSRCLDFEVWRQSCFNGCSRQFTQLMFV